MRANIAWLDFRPEDMQSAKELIRELQEEGLLDELGFGVLQNAIAERLYPATTTIMTASRYLFFITALYEHLEKKQTPSREIEECARKMQHQLRDVLKQTEGDRRGVIGFQAGKDLKRLPSNIYWNGMRRLGLFRRNWSESTYQVRLDQVYAESVPHADDDGALHAGSDAQGAWDSRRPPPVFLDARGTFKADTNFTLTRSEAKDLLHRFETCFPNALLTYQLRNGIPEMEYPWDVPRPPAELAQVLRHARALSVLAQGVLLQYYALLLEAREQRGLAMPPVDLEGMFERWFDHGRELLVAWDLKEFFETDFWFEAQRPGARSFLTHWRDEALSQKDAHAVFASQKARKLVRDRELHVKPAKARLKFPAYLDTWNPAFLQQGDLGEYGLFYRHRIGQRFAREIIQGLRGGRA